MSFGITIYNGLPAMTFKGGNDLFTNVVLSLEIVQDSWWFDPAFGLRKRKRMKNTAATARLIQGDIERALKWLLDIGRSTQIEVTMWRDISIDRTRLRAHVAVTGTTGNLVTYDKFVEVV